MTKAEKIAQQDYQDVVKTASSTPGGWDNLRKQVEIMRRGLNARSQQFSRRNIYSYAYDKYKQNQKFVTAQDVKNMTSNQLIHQFVVYQSFFQSETSSIQGIAKVNREQDARIFGTYKNGRPKRRMTEAERKLYWDLYDEYINRHPVYTQGSNVVQGELKSVLFGEDSSPNTFEAMLEKLHAQLEQDKIHQDMESVPGVYTANGLFNPKEVSD